MKGKMMNYNDRRPVSALYEHVYTDENGIEYSYSVDNEKKMLTPYRRMILDDFMKTNLPQKDDYYKEWGEKNTAERVKETLRHLSNLIKESGRSEKCKKKWGEDIQYLVDKHLPKYMDKGDIINYLFINELRKYMDIEEFKKHIDKTSNR